jgi:hypothetical protein
MQELAYSTYFSLKHLSGQGYLFQESRQSSWTAFYYCVAYLSWVDKGTGTGSVRNATSKLHDVRNAFGTLAS